MRLDDQFGFPEWATAVSFSTEAPLCSSTPALGRGAQVAPSTQGPRFGRVARCVASFCANQARTTPNVTYGVALKTNQMQSNGSIRNRQVASSTLALGSTFRVDFFNLRLLL